MVLVATHLWELVVLAASLGGLLVMLRVAGRWLGVVQAIWPTLLLFALVAGFSGGVDAGMSAGLRLLLLVTAGVLFFTTTTPEDLGDALVASGVRAQHAFLLEGTLRLVPTMGALVREARDALASRGIPLHGLYLLRNGPLLLGPILVSALRFADDLAEGLEARGFGSPHRTLLHDYHFRACDWGLVAGMIVLNILTVGWKLRA
jgi:energy-coupling factor transport system permease protein